MFSLPPPPQFTLPPPPMLPPDILDLKILFQLTCSSIQQSYHHHHQQQPQINPYLTLISCITFFLITIFLTLLFIWIQSFRQQKTSINNLISKPIYNISRDLSISSDRSYETISSGIYLESVNTSETTISTNSNKIICNYCHQLSSLSC